MVGRARSVWTEQMLMILPRPRGNHVPGRLPPHEEGAGQVRGDHPLPVRDVEVEHRHAVLDAGVVHQDLQRPDVFLDPGDAPGGLGVAGDVEGAAVHPARRVVRGHRGLGGLEPLGVDAVEHHGGAGVGQARARALPIPRLEPVTSAVRPVRSKSPFMVR